MTKVLSVCVRGVHTVIVQQSARTTVLQAFLAKIIKTPLLVGVSILIFISNIRVAKYTMCDVMCVARVVFLPGFNARVLFMWPVVLLRVYCNCPTLFGINKFHCLSPGHLFVRILFDITNVRKMFTDCVFGVFIVAVVACSPLCLFLARRA